MYKVLLTDPNSKNGIELLKKAKLDVINKPGISEDELYSYLPEIDGWIIRSGTQVKLEHIEACNNLKVIGRHGVGVNNIDLEGKLILCINACFNSSVVRM